MGMLMRSSTIWLWDWDRYLVMDCKCEWRGARVSGSLSMNWVTVDESTRWLVGESDWVSKYLTLNMKMSWRVIVWMRLRMNYCERLNDLEYLGDWVSHKMNIFLWLTQNGLTVYCWTHSVTNDVCIHLTSRLLYYCVNNDSLYGVSRGFHDWF